MLSISYERAFSDVAHTMYVCAYVQSLYRRGVVQANALPSYRGNEVHWLQEHSKALGTTNRL